MEVILLKTIYFGKYWRIRLFRIQFATRQVYNLFQEPVIQPPLGFKIAEEETRQFFSFPLLAYHAQ